MTIAPLEDTAWCVIDGTAVLLDIAGDRYFRLPDEQNRRFLAAADGHPPDAPVQPTSFPLPPDWVLPDRGNDASAPGAFRLGDVARSIWTQRRVERRLADRSFFSVLADLRGVQAANRTAEPVLSPRARREVCAFEQARLLRSAAGRCLPRSVALALCLARRRCRAHVVLGVKLAPFAAHCWVQVGSAVVGDELEEVLRYTPILVI